MARCATIERNTKETKICLTLDLDGTGKADIHTGIGFFDHMLNGFARHGLFDLSLRVDGDLEVDTHHTIEDTGIVLGKAIKEAVGDKKGIVRYGTMILPMDQRRKAGLGLRFGFLLFAFQNSDIAVQGNQLLLLRFDFCLSLRFFSHLLFKLLF